MLDWKRFEDEVPSQRRSVIVAGNWADDGELADWNFHLLEACMGNEGSFYWDFMDGDQQIVERRGAWSEVVELYCYTHWAYVDPPVAEPTL